MGCVRSSTRVCLSAWRMSGCFGVEVSHRVAEDRQGNPGGFASTGGGGVGSGCAQSVSVELNE